MAILIQPVDIGQLPNDGTGDPLRTAFDKLNNNVVTLSQAGSPGGSVGSIQYKDSNGVFDGITGFTFNSATHILNLGVNLIPTSNVNINIGSINSKVSQIFTDSIRISNVTVSEAGNVFSFNNNVTNRGAIINADSVRGNNAIISDTLSVNGIVTGKVKATTLTSVSEQIIFEIPPSQMKTGVFEVLTVYETGYVKESQTATIKVSNSGIGYAVTYAVYGTIFNTVPLTKYIADTGYGNVRLGVSPLYPVPMTHTVSYTIYNQ